MHDELKKCLLEASYAGAEVLKLYFNKRDLQIDYKEGVNNLVTEADHASEKAIIETIKKYFPNHNILTEEKGSEANNNEYTWIIDPIDGTINFAHGIPICCVSIAIEFSGETIMGCVYSPFLNECYFAEKGKGATLNDKVIHVSHQSKLINSCLVTGFPYKYLDTENGPLQIFEVLIRNAVPVRRLGSAALDLCWVAAGRFDGFYEHSLQPWDSAAGALIVEEAGGKVTDFGNNKFSPHQIKIVATNGKIHQQLIDLINGKNTF